MKNTLSMAELESQMAVELPDRDLMAPVVITLPGGGLIDVNVGDVTINIVNNTVNVAVGILNSGPVTVGRG